MTVVATCATKGSPGATTVALALAVAYSERGATLLVEFDTSGGDLAARCGLPADRGLVSLAAAARHGAQVDIAAHTAILPIGGEVVLAPSDPAQAAAAIAGTATRIVELASETYLHVVVDCGRLLTDGLAGPVLDRADIALLVMRPTVASVEQALVRLPMLPIDRTSIVLVDDGPYSAAEVESATGVLVTRVLPLDRRGASGLCGGLAVRAARRAPLVREARSLAEIVETAGAREAATT